MILRYAVLVIVILFNVAHAQLSPEMQTALAARDALLDSINFELRAAQATQLQCASVEYYVLSDIDGAIEKTRVIFIAREWSLIDYGLVDNGLVMLIDTDVNNPRAVGLGGILDTEYGVILWFTRCLQRRA